MSIAQRLRDAVADLPHGQVTFNALLQAHGPAARGSLMLLLAVPCLLPIPGTGTLLGCALFVMATTMWRGGASAELPRRVAEWQMPRAWAARVLTTLATVYAVAGRVARSRLERLASESAEARIGLSVAAMAVLLVLPIPFGNILPALALVLVGLGLVFKDGLLVLLGELAALVTACVTSGLLVAAAGWGLDWAAAALA